MSRAFNFGDIALRPSIHLANVLLAWVTGTMMMSAQQANTAYGRWLPHAPETRTSVTLSAVTDKVSDRGAFLFNGHETAPTIHVKPGSTLHVRYTNAMSSTLREPCIVGPCGNMTNLHFHGLHVSPAEPQDDVLTMMAFPGQSLLYSVVIPKDQPPGLYWYHTHPHGESYQQGLDGMSGAIVVDGLERYYPELSHMEEQILILRDRVVSSDNPKSGALRSMVDARQNCNASSAPIERLFTLNGELRPKIAIAPGERQLWRVVNASPDLYADLSLDREKFDLVALDGMPLSFHDRGAKPKPEDHLLLPPGGRAEFIVTGLMDGKPQMLRSRCFDTGIEGDPNPSMVLADIVPGKSKTIQRSTVPSIVRSPVYEPVARSLLSDIAGRPPDFIVRFSEDEHGFYINNRQFKLDDSPMVTATVGTYYHWRVVNATREAHPFHIHQVHFLVYREGDEEVPSPEWRDTINIPAGLSVDLVMDFTDPIIRGISVFHCHLLKHEDKGMMAKILFR